MPTYLINSRKLSSRLPIKEELKLAPQKNYLFSLSYLSVLSLNGEKTSEFLQGQLTANISKVGDIEMIQSAQCNLKGRILSFMDVVHWHGFKLVLPSDMLEQTQNSLNKTAILSRVQIKRDETIRVYGFYLANPDDLIPESLFLPKELYSKAQSDSVCYYHLGDNYYIFLVMNAPKDLHQGADSETSHIIEDEFAKPFIEKEQMLGSITWHTLRLKHHQLSIYPESRGLFLPHRLDLQNTPYISFDKGCYKGQEIIARTHYRATLKHELRYYIVNRKQNTDAFNLFSGQKLFKEDASIEIGELVDYSYLDDGCYLLAVSIVKNAPARARLETSNEIIHLE